MICGTDNIAVASVEMNMGITVCTNVVLPYLILYLKRPAIDEKCREVVGALYGAGEDFVLMVTSQDFYGFIYHTKVGVLVTPYPTDYQPMYY